MSTVPGALPKPDHVVVVVFENNDTGYTFAEYSESMPAEGFKGCSGSGGDYARKHNPWSD